MPKALHTHTMASSDCTNAPPPISPSYQEHIVHSTSPSPILCPEVDPPSPPLVINLTSQSPPPRNLDDSTCFVSSLKCSKFNYTNHEYISHTVFCTNLRQGKAVWCANIIWCHMLFFQGEQTEENTFSLSFVYITAAMSPLNG